MLLFYSLPLLFLSSAFGFHHCWTVLDHVVLDRVVLDHVVLGLPGSLVYNFAVLRLANLGGVSLQVAYANDVRL